MSEMGQSANPAAKVQSTTPATARSRTGPISSPNWRTSRVSAASNSSGGRKIASSVSALGSKWFRVPMMSPRTVPCAAPDARLVSAPSAMPTSASITA